MQYTRLAAGRGASRYAYASAVRWRAESGSSSRFLQTATISREDIETQRATSSEQVPGRRLRETAKTLLRERDQQLAPPPSPFLTDRHHRRHSYLRISLTERCNLRCMYCMPEEGVPLTPKESLLTTTEVERLARLFVQEGVTKIRLTGGEPTIRKDLPEVVAGLSALRRYGLQQIGITTNGLTLTRHVSSLIASGLTHLNVSLDTLDPFKFELMTRRPASGLQKVLKGVDTALAMDVQHVKINVVVMRGVNDKQDALDFVRWARNRNVIVRFIEYMPFDGNRWKPEKLVPYRELQQTIESHFGPLEKLGDDANDTSKHWRVPGHAGSIGFITSMTDHFCGTCNRLRITADGNLKVCLFGNAEVSLRDAMRFGLREQGLIPASDQQLLEIIGAAVGRKHAKHAGMSDLETLAQGRIPHKRRRWKSRPSLLPQLQSHVLGGTAQLRPFSTTSMRNRSPCDEVDDKVDRMQADERQIDGAQSIDRPQSWSDYMGSSTDGDDSPWASLDAFVDGPRQSERSVAQSAMPSDGSWEEAATAAAAAHASSVQRASDPEIPPSILQSQPRLTHLDKRGENASMVDISTKTVTVRSATAEGRVYVSPEVLQLLKGATTMGDSAQLGQTLAQKVHRKGPVLQIAQLAGIMGAKKTSELIPLCHGLNLSHVDVQLQLVSDNDSSAEFSQLESKQNQHMNMQSAPQPFILVQCTAKTTAQTGVEMEALMGVSVTCLTLWDMLKSVAGKEMRIEGLIVTAKQGGKSGDWQRQK